MKHRHSFFVEDAKRLGQGSFELVNGKNGQSSTLKLRQLNAAREWKSTVDIKDLSQKNSRELGKGTVTIQYVKDTAKDVPEPLQRGFVPGLHVLWNGSTLLSELPFIGSLLPASSPDPISLPGNKSYLHLGHLPSVTIDSLFETLWSILASGTDSLLLAHLAKADVIDFDIVSGNTIQIRAIWASAPHDDGWRLEISTHQDTVVEVAVFHEEGGEDKDEHALGGVRGILGVDKELQPTLFTFPHRNHILSRAQLNTSLSPPYGSHPVLQTRLPVTALQAPVNDTLNSESCNLHALYTLSNEVFVDKYQLAQLAQFQSGGIRRLSGVWGETDLENPSYKTAGWGSIVLVDIVEQDPSELKLELPLHLRYLEPQIGGGTRNVDILPPEIFWACENAVEDFTLSPFTSSSRSVLHSLFPHDTVFYHLPNHVCHDPNDGQSQWSATTSIKVPVADLSQAQLIQNLTILGVLVGFTYLLVTGIRVGIKGLHSRAKGKDKPKDL